jgi:hypothetical protein
VEKFKLATYALGEKLEYLPLLVAVMVIFSTAFFGFILPKYFDYNHGRNQRLLKDALDIEKALKERHKNRCGNKYDEPELEKVIAHYKNNYLKDQASNAEKEIEGKRVSDNILYWGTIVFVAGSIIAIGVISVLVLALLRWVFS